MSRPLRFALIGLMLGLFALAAGTGFPLCPTAGTLGIPCPGCGLTRATLTLLTGDLRGALRLHPLVWLLTPLFVGFVGVAGLDLLRDPQSPARQPLLHWNGRGMNIAAVALLVLTLGVWLARFGGYFGGPAPVTSLRDWLTDQAGTARR